MSCTAVQVKRESWRSRTPTHDRVVCAVRDYLIAPILEEIMFRGILHSVLHSDESKDTHTIVCVATYFAISHLIYALAQQFDVTATTIQLVCTSIFSCIASYMYIRTNSLWVPILAHITCNVLGPPTFTCTHRNCLFHILGIFVFSIYIVNFVG
uniref:CAAX prenyl protease 2 n=1 Tax=Lygus hesperus TaxID=30085 RepID=A0A0A9YHS6_LYGHE